MSKIITLNQMKKALVEKVVHIADNPNDYNDHAKGWFSGQLSLIKEILGDE